MANPVETGFPRVQLPICTWSRHQERMLTNLPVRIVGINGAPTDYPEICTSLSRRGIGFETSAWLEVGKVIEFEFIQVTDEAVRYWVRILIRKDRRYGRYYVNDEGVGHSGTELMFNSLRLCGGVRRFQLKISIL